jgi:putative sterol carrier protein
VSEVGKIFKGLCKRFNKANVKVERSYYFSLGDHEKWTIHITKEKCVVRPGENDEADCFFKGPAELFLDVWNGKHQLGPTDFLTGRVKSNNPLLLKDFVRAFQKSDP